MAEHLNFIRNMYIVKLKLNRENDLLAKLRHSINPVLLRTIAYVIFKSHLQYEYQLWRQKQTKVLQNIVKIQSKNLRIINFQNPLELRYQIYKGFKISQLKDIVTMTISKFVYDQMTEVLPRTFENFLINKTSQHLHNTTENSLDVSQVK